MSDTERAIESLNKFMHNEYNLGGTIRESLTLAISVLKAQGKTEKKTEAVITERNEAAITECNYIIGNMQEPYVVMKCAQKILKILKGEKT